MWLPGPGPLAWLLPLPFAFAVLLIFLRHARLALLVSLAPLPGLLLGRWLIGPETQTAYVFGICAGLLLAGTLSRRFLSGAGDWRPVAWAAAGAAVTALEWHAGKASSLDWAAPALLLLAAGSAAGLTLAGWHRLSLDEGFIARANRALEARTRLSEHGAHIAVPRWALALSGIVAVAAALAWFEMGRRSVPDYLGDALLLSAAAALARDWRAVIASAVCAVLLWLLHAERALEFFALPALLLAGAAHARREEGGAAWRLTLEDEGAGLLFAALSLAILALPPGGPAMMFPAAAAFAAALIFLPALTVALWTIFPRRRSIEEMYRG
jgi:hypothetical protein